MLWIVTIHNVPRPVCVCLVCAFSVMRNRKSGIVQSPNKRPSSLSYHRGTVVNGRVVLSSCSIGILFMVPEPGIVLLGVLRELLRISFVDARRKRGRAVVRRRPTYSERRSLVVSVMHWTGTRGKLAG